MFVHFKICHIPGISVYIWHFWIRTNLKDLNVCQHVPNVLTSLGSVLSYNFALYVCNHIRCVLLFRKLWLLDSGPVRAETYRSLINRLLGTSLTLCICWFNLQKLIMCTPRPCFMLCHFSTLCPFTLLLNLYSVSLDMLKINTWLYKAYMMRLSVVWVPIFHCSLWEYHN